jgi:hypothetical protein
MTISGIKTRSRLFMHVPKMIRGEYGLLEKPVQPPTGGIQREPLARAQAPSGIKTIPIKSKADYEALIKLLELQRNSGQTNPSFFQPFENLINLLSQPEKIGETEFEQIIENAINHATNTLNARHSRPLRVQIEGRLKGLQELGFQRFIELPLNISVQ